MGKILDAETNQADAFGEHVREPRSPLPRIARSRRISE
jgi:hypothetical protein